MKSHVWHRAEHRRGPGSGRRFVLCGWLGCVLAVCLLCHCAKPVKIGERGHDFEIQTLEGGSVSLKSLSGKVVFLHFWATWCPPCLVELPLLEQFSKKLDADKYSVLAVCVDQAGPESVQKFVTGAGYGIQVCLDPGGSLARRYGTLRFPETYVLDPRGVVQRKLVGAGTWKMSEWAQFLQDFDGQKPH